MTELTAATRAFVLEREMPHPPEKIWRALTEGRLIEEWLMKNDFQPVVGHGFNFRATSMPHWNGVTDCEVLTVEPYKRLAYSWNSSGDEAANGLKTVVTWTLTPANGGTLSQPSFLVSAAVHREERVPERVPAEPQHRGHGDDGNDDDNRALTHS